MAIQEQAKSHSLINIVYFIYLSNDHSITLSMSNCNVDYPHMLLCIPDLYICSVINPSHTLKAIYSR